ncbi:23S rRNA (uracil1939-C5)-methyltransferase [Pilibacter termitis]|uniref:23S rRNA (Uracil1939-C5)-methyltransferase n=1 Tax=Pilibacter termitis TaxID=263852 RepID=A0A1T4Q1P5_9ENTE|nr:23S rRNA (uracil(1939)-C(5))-methyltransferase RlmD [Pilibacter termitis]SJZ97138.1 23S rRNA (uracil1939-C5)-methyltransferase [Pilibacter termitis]
MVKLPVQKNEQLTVDIIDLTHEGLGVAKIEGYPLFIENALPNERVNVHVLQTKKKFGYARVLEWLEKSPYRVENADNALIRTGIAPLMHLEYSEQLKFKREQVVNVMEKIAKMPDVPILETIGMERATHYRNKAQIPVRLLNGELETGFYRKNSHQLVPIEDFFIQDEKIDEIVVKVRDILRKFKVKPYNEENNTGEVRHIIVRKGHYSKEIMIILVTRKAKLMTMPYIVKEIIREIPDVTSILQNIQPEKTNVILGRENRLLHGSEKIVDVLLGNKFEISSQSFYQVNTEMAEVLYQKAIEFANLKEEDVAIDAYCGIGTIGQSFAKKVKEVYGVEIVPEAVEDAKKNAVRNGLTNCHYETGKAEVVMQKWLENGIRPNVIFVDPARKGLEESFITASAKTNPEKIVYISCNPSSFARDVKKYAELGYFLEKVLPVDLFPQTYHVELVGLMSRKKG